MCAPEIRNFSQINDANKRFLQCLEISIFYQISGPHMHSRNKDKARKVRFAQVEKCASRTFTRPLTVLQTNPGIGAISGVNLELFLEIRTVVHLQESLLLFCHYFQKIYFSGECMWAPEI